MLVAGFFFAGDLDPTTASQFNHGEIFYSVVADPDSTLSCAHSAAQVNNLTPVSFVLEFQHMISFNQHVLLRGGTTEATWLNEGISHFAEEVAGRQAAGINGWCRHRIFEFDGDCSAALRRTAGSQGKTENQNEQGKKQEFCHGLFHAARMCMHIRAAINKSKILQGRFPG